MIPNFAAMWPQFLAVWENGAIAGSLNSNDGQTYTWGAPFPEKSFTVNK